MERKELSRSQWSRVRKRRSCHGMGGKNFAGETELIHIIKASKPLIVRFQGVENTTIVDDGYCWLQIAPEDQHWWLTTMLDPQGRITQYYFDITWENHLLGSEESWFLDLYLDVVVMPDGRMELLDADELEQALADGHITREMFDSAWAWANQLMADLEGRVSELEAFCQRTYNRLLPELENEKIASK